MPSQAKINFYPFAEGAALHLEGSHRLWVLNHSSAVLWCLHEDHGTGNALVTAYANHFGLRAEQAQTDVVNALAEFEQAGLLSASQITNHESQITAPIPPVSAPSPNTCWSRCYHLAGVFWQIACSDDVSAEIWFSSLAHLETDAASTLLHYELTESSSGWTLAGAGETVTGLAGDEVLPWLLTLLFSELCHRQPHRLLLHAAAAWRNGRILLLPGESTFGKSTLAAALAAQGWTLYSDELAPLDPVSLQVAPFPLPVGIKSRSLLALQSYSPDLAEKPAFRRADGQVIRYLAPPQLSLAAPAANPAPVAALVFPRFLADTPARLDRLTPLEALQRLAQTGSSERPLCANDVEAMLCLAGQRPCWSLVYSDLAEAVAMVDEVSDW